MSWSWVPPRPGEEDGSDGGPSPALRRAVTVLAVLLTGVLVAFYASRGIDGMRAGCVADRPEGVAVESVSSSWRWWPPGFECQYPVGELTGA